MSRGYGQVQRKIIEALREHAGTGSRGMSLHDLVGHAYYGGRISATLSWYERKEIVAVRRALSGLVADGVVIDLGQLSGARRFCIHYAYYKR
jgi:hypothetical protein